MSDNLNQGTFIWSKIFIFNLKEQFSTFFQFPPFFCLHQQKLGKCPSGSSSPCESPPISRPLKALRGPRPSAENTIAATSAMKSDSLGPTAATKPKPGTTDSSRAKTSSPVKKKPPSATKAVLNGSVGPTVRRENSTANGTTGKSLQEKSGAPRARPKSAPTGVTGAVSKAKANKTTASEKDSTHGSTSDSPGNAQCSQTTPSTSGSVSPESSVSSPQNNSSQGLTMVTFIADPFSSCPFCI